jgi:transcriptional regulator with XRE-family HTH domain
VAFYITSRESYAVDKINIRQKFGIRIKELRAVTGLSQEAFADKCGFARSYMSRVERGGANPSIDAIEVLAVALGVQIKDLFADGPVMLKKRAPEITLVPYAPDGSHFGPHLERAGKFTVGDKDDEVQLEDFDESLAYLRRMGVAKWRRPNAAGNWGIVSAVRWDEQPSNTRRKKEY